MAELTITGLGKSFGDLRALDEVSILAEEGRFLTLLGPSGCGKSTTLWSVAGLHTPDEGTITIGDRTVFDPDRGIEVPPEERSCGVVFQSYAIWPHLSVADNVAYPLKLRRVSRAGRRARVAELLELVELGPLGERHPHELSGGQQQRVALARALAHEPRLLLLDEPFSNLDAKLRERARTWLRDLQQRVGITTVFVTHDQDEALSMSDRIVVMDHGRVAQIGTPEEIYLRPADRFVADFVGGINLLPGVITRLDGDTAVFVPDGTDRPVEIGVEGDVRPGPATLGVRPESITIAPDGAIDGPGTLLGSAAGRLFLGDRYRHLVDVGSVRVSLTTELASIPAAPVLRLPDRCRVFPATISEAPSPAADPTPRGHSEPPAAAPPRPLPTSRTPRRQRERRPDRATDEGAGADRHARRRLHLRER